MFHPHEDIKAHRYYWEYIKRFGKESYESLKRDFFISLVLAFFTWLFGRGDRNVVGGTILFVRAVAWTFGFVALLHLAHVALLLFRERYHPEIGGIQPVAKGYGVFGAILLLAMFCGLSFETYRLLLRQTATFTIDLPTPMAPPVVPSSEPKRPEPYRYSPSTKNSSPQTETPQPTQPGPTVQTPPPQVAQTPPLTWLERMIQENRALTPFDRDKLAQELYATDRLLKQMQAVSYKVSNEFTKVSQDRQSGALAKNVEEHIKTLKELEPAANEQYNALMKFQTDNQYFEHQTEYIFGDNPYNAGVSLMQNAVSGMGTDLTRWSGISNRDKPEILLLVTDFQNTYQEKLNGFFKWAVVCLQRNNQMRQSLDPNRTVDPLPTGVVAPAPAMFTSNRT